MKVKLDENLPDDLASLLRAADYDVATVAEEGMADTMIRRSRASLSGEGCRYVNHPVRYQHHQLPCVQTLPVPMETTVTAWGMTVAVALALRISPIIP